MTHAKLRQQDKVVCQRTAYKVVWHCMPRTKSKYMHAQACIPFSMKSQDFSLMASDIKPCGVEGSQEPSFLTQGLGPGHSCQVTLCQGPHHMCQATGPGHTVASTPRSHFQNQPQHHGMYVHCTLSVVHSVVQCMQAPAHTGTLLPQMVLGL
jgi:hypothetical protein